jgi:hypothetical protein
VNQIRKVSGHKPKRRLDKVLLRETEAIGQAKEEAEKSK